jgi:16S rRNA (guanine(966)-N(2))-methyltransferase RsmD
MTRIIAGSARGRRLAAPRGAATRPTSEKVRGAVFNVLGQFFDGGAVLDLYAGTGALALEALSRGCERALCVEEDRGAAEILRRNAEACGFAAAVEVRRGKVLSVLPSLPAAAFTLVFADPPYETGPDGALALVGRVVAPGGRVVAEHDARRPPAERFDGLECADRRAYGGTGISIYLRRELDSI